MMSTDRTDSLEDTALPGLRLALDLNVMGAILAEAVGVAPRASGGPCGTVQVLNHKVGQRCTMLYTLQGQHDGDPCVLPSCAVGKLYGRRRLAARIYQLTLDVRRALSSPQRRAGIPTPYALVADLGLILQEYVEGVDLRYALAADNGRVPLAQAADWLAALHGIAPLQGLRAPPLEHELQKVERWGQEVAACVPPDVGRRLRDAQQVLLRVGREWPPYKPAVIHKDFYYANLLWDGQRIWVLDFDEVRLGDPALDVGHFLAHLENLAYRTTGQASAFKAQATVFLESYLTTAPIDFATRLPLYMAYTFLKLAATEVHRKQKRWQLLTEVLTDLTCQEIERGLS